MLFHIRKRKQQKKKYIRNNYRCHKTEKKNSTERTSVIIPRGKDWGWFSSFFQDGGLTELGGFSRVRNTVPIDSTGNETEKRRKGKVGGFRSKSGDKAVRWKEGSTQGSTKRHFSTAYVQYRFRQT